VFLISGCSTLREPGVVANLVDQVRQMTTQLCGFIPIAATVSGIFGTGMTVPFEIAAAICNAVSTPRGTVGASVNGVAVKGYFVKERTR
jgi:hypothetical protein